MMLRLLAVVLSVLGLNGCSQVHDFEYFTFHPRSLKNELVTCQMMSADKRNQRATCAAALKARQELLPLLHDAVRTPYQYGLRIMAVQNELAVKQTQKLKFTYQQMLVPIRILSER